jgi:hypothetical protein
VAFRVVKAFEELVIGYCSISVDSFFMDCWLGFKPVK